MCGRYALYGPTSRLHEQFDASIDELPEGFGPRYNAAPLQMLPVVRQRPNGERVVHLLRWGLVPSWSKDDSIAAKLINARAESLAEKPSFRAAYKARRCIIPACGFFEWKATEHGKQPYYIHPADGGLFGFAGLWERWSPPDGSAIDTFSVITTAANDAIRPLHDRMPVILAPQDYSIWLSRATEPEHLRALIGTLPVTPVSLFPVLKGVGNVKNDSPDLIAPVE
jgi:putative SOS response-associated peptidase YedK